MLTYPFVSFWHLLAPRIKDHNVRGESQVLTCILLFGSISNEKKLHTLQYDFPFLDVFYLSAAMVDCPSSQPNHRYSRAAVRRQKGKNPTNQSSLPKNHPKSLDLRIFRRYHWSSFFISLFPFRVFLGKRSYRSNKL